MLGVYISDHPLNAYAERLNKLVTVTSRELEATVQSEDEAGPMQETGTAGGSPLYDGMPVVMAGMIAGKKNLVTKNNKMMAFVDLEDLYGVSEVVVFPNVYERCQESLTEDNVVVIKGKLNFKEGEVPKLLADSVTGVDEVEGNLQGTPPRLKVRIPKDIDEKRTLQILSHVFHENRGRITALIYLQNGRIVKSNTGIEWTEFLEEELKEIVGESNVKMDPGKEQKR